VTDAPTTQTSGGTRTRELQVELNGNEQRLMADPLTPLALVLRDDVGLTGTKLGCETGDCGACTVLVDDVPTASCLLPAIRADGRRVTTNEGLGAPAALHPLQEAFKRHNASQCGYCIPGILIAASPLLQRSQLSRRDVVSEMSGNLCRCTGYEAIIDAVLDAHQKVRSGQPGGRGESRGGGGDD
jgi:carbon-monoxide dehydrogenase small subunit